MTDNCHSKVCQERETESRRPKDERKREGLNGERERESKTVEEIKERAGKDTKKETDTHRDRKMLQKTRKRESEQNCCQYHPKSF